jgi:CRISPR-associated Csx2 family protein
MQQQRALVSFLGKVTQKNGGKYRTANYQFQDGATLTGQAIVAPLVQWQRDQGKPVSRLVIAGTATSMWDSLTELDPCLENEAGINLATAVQDQASLDAFAGWISEQLGLDVRLRIIGECRSAEEQVDLVRHLAEHVPDGADIILDITHSFRHLPMLGLTAAHLLTHARACNLEGVYYGMLEATANGITPVVDLRGSLRLLEISEALATHSNTGRFAPLAEVLHDELPDLAQGAFYLDTARPSQGLSYVNRSLNQLKTATDPLRQTLNPFLQRSLGWVKDSTLQHRLQLHQAEALLRGGDLSSCSMLLLEALTSAVVYQLHKTTPQPYEVRNALRKKLGDALKARSDEDHYAFVDLNAIRNALAHGTQPDEWARQARAALQSEAKLKGFLQSTLAWAKGVVQDLEAGTLKL